MILSQPNLIRPIIHPGITRLDLNVLLLSLLLSSSAVTAQHRNGTQDNEYGIYTNFDPTIALVIVVLVCAFFLLGVLFMFIRHCSEPDVVANLSAAAAARNFSPQVGLDPAVIEKFPIFFYSEVKNVKIGRDTLECAICLGEFDDDETLRLLPKCNHVFHPECIDEWLAYHVTCPVCRGVLAIDSAGSPKVSPQETAADGNQDDIVAYLSQSSNEIAITVNEEQNQPTNIANMSQTKNRQPRSSISGRFPRSHSTGHSLIQGGENIERYTLRLPEEVRTQIMANAKLKRTSSVNLISTKEWSAMKIERGRQIGWSERWSILKNPAFVSKGSSVKSSSKIDNEGDSDSVDEKNLLGAVKSNCLNLRVEGVEEPSTGVGGTV